MEDLLEELTDISDEYTREQFDADVVRLTIAIAEKHGISEAEVPQLVADHNYTHSADDIEDDYIQTMTMGRWSGHIE